MRIARLIFAGSIAALAVRRRRRWRRIPIPPPMPMPRRSRTRRLHRAATPTSRRPMGRGHRCPARRPGPTAQAPTRTSPPREPRTKRPAEERSPPSAAREARPDVVMRRAGAGKKRSTASGPDPPRTRAMSAARYRRSVSYPGCPKRAPAAVTDKSFMKLKPFGRCTVKMATSSTTIIGTLTSGINKPMMTANPPNISSGSWPMPSSAEQTRQAR